MRAVAIVLGGCGTAALWITGAPNGLSSWFYRIHWRALRPEPSASVLAIVALALALASLRAASVRHHLRALVFLVLASLAMQGSSLLLVGPGLETAFERFDGGHGTFLEAAYRLRERPLGELLRGYHAEAERGSLGDFAPSKPPGTFALYAAIVGLSELPAVRHALAPIAAAAQARGVAGERAPRIAAAAVLFPMLTALVVLPIVLLGRALGGSLQVGYEAALLWASCPAVLVITHHTDGSWYALLVALGSALSALGARRDRRDLTIAAGLVLAIAIWSSYGLLPAIGIAGAAQLSASIADTSVRTPRAWVRRAARHGAILGVAIACALGALVLAGVFPDPPHGYEVAMEHHTRWKLSMIGGVWGLVGALELWMYAGFALLAVLLLAAAPALRVLFGSVPRRTVAASAALALGLLAVHLVVMLYAGSNESARLWLFQLPAIACACAIDLRRASPRRSPRALLALAVIAQLALVPLTRAAQPW